MGDLIKVTYRMQEYAQPNRVLVGPVTAAAIKNKYVVQRAGNLAMRGQVEPIPVFEVSLPKTAPFILKEDEMSDAFKDVAEKMKARSSKGQDS
jgi:class 3 adenylate cyclase